jgi:hypothetical protein
LWEAMDGVGGGRAHLDVEHVLEREVRDVVATRLGQRCDGREVLQHRQGGASSQGSCDTRVAHRSACRYVCVRMYLCVLVALRVRGLGHGKLQFEKGGRVLVRNPGRLRQHL